jgi:hypothetical protein
MLERRECPCGKGQVPATYDAFRAGDCWDCWVKAFIPGGVRRPAQAVKPPPPGGPGTELKAMLAARGYEACLGCQMYARKMDLWGVQGCRDRRAEIVARLQAQAAELGLAASLAAWAGAGWFVDEAIRRAEAKQAEGKG